MSDERFEEFLKREAAAYQAPPAATPREEMWSVIAKARVTQAGGAAHGGGTPLRSRWLRYAPWIGMAATLLVGVGIGRFAMQEPLDATPGTIASVDTPMVAPPTVSSTDESALPLRVAPRSTGSAVRLASNGSPLIESPSPMQIASREHLARAEALISVVAATPADAVMDSLTGRWAREMLTNTRLLLDSPAGDDPARRRLFEDLEMILVQLVQRSGTAADERRLIDRSLQRTQLLTRLRTSATGI